MGDAWHGYDAVLDRPVAVKVLRRRAVAGPPQLAEEFAKRFKRGARITARIQHPGVPQEFDALLDDAYERLLLVMELVNGIPLSAYIHPGHPLPASWAAAVAAQVATACGTPATCPSSNATGSPIGAHQYMAPEHRGGRTSPQTGLYPLGCVPSG